MRISNLKNRRIFTLDIVNIIDNTPEYWNVEEHDLFVALESSVLGLSSEEASQRLSIARRGDKQHIVSVTKLLSRQFRSPIILLLLSAAVLSAMLGEHLDALIIALIVFVSGLLGFVQERGAVRAVEALESLVRVHAEVLRDGQEVSVPISEIVGGDVVRLRVGDVVPGDGRVISANQLFVNESALTGEGLPCNKQPGVVERDARLADRTNYVFLGTSVVSGEGSFVIVNTGSATEFGRVKQHVARQHVPTSFEKGVTSFGYMLIRITAFLVFGVMLINISLQRDVVDSFLFALALAVGLTPQMLPAIITLSLSRGAIILSRENVIVKRLDAIEDVGSLDILCTDKTGTLTVGAVHLHGVWNINGIESGDVHRLAYWNAHLQESYLNPLDDAITEFDVSDAMSHTKIGELPFDFHRKRVSVWLDDFTLVTKGAFESVLSCCTNVLLEDGTVIAMDIDNSPLRHVKKTFEQLSESGLRVIAVAKRYVDPDEELSIASETAMTFCGFISFVDPPKPGVAAAISELNHLGLSIRIVTGDNSFAARYVASAVGISTNRVMTGKEVANLDDEELSRAVENVSIFAETDPLDKERIVRALSRNGHTVGFLGDGINDAPALHAADVGISVDTAVDIAKQTADLVLLNKDLAVVAIGVQKGRQIFVNTLKYVQVTSSANFGNMISLAVSSMFLPFLPLLPVQILLLNFLSDVPGMSIAGDNVDRKELLRPQTWSIHRLHGFMIVFGLTSTAFDIMTFAILRYVFDASEGLFQSAWFVESAFTELAAMLILRTQMQFWKSRPGNALLVSSLIVTCVSVLAPFSPVAGTLKMVALPWHVMVTMIVIAIGFVCALEFVKSRQLGSANFFNSYNSEIHK